MATRSTAKDTTFYLYVGSQWTGPYPVADIRQYLHDGRVAADTYAYDPYEQRHSTVGELLADASAGGMFSAAPATGTGSRGTSSLQIQDLEERECSATATATFDGVAPDLRAFYHAYLDLAEDRNADTGTALATLRRCHRDLTAILDTDTDARQVLVTEIKRVADYLANRHQDPRLWDLLAAIRETPSEEHESTARAAAEIVTHLVQAGERHGAGSAALRSDGTTRRILASAANEISSTQRDLESIQKAYAALQERHALDLEQARELLAQVEASRDDEIQGRTQGEAEVRALAAEVHRLAGEVAEANHDATLLAEVEHLGADLREAGPSVIAPLAEGLLIRMVARLRSLAAAPGALAESGALAELRAELADVRAELAQARAQVMTLSEERERLRKQLEEQRVAAERISAAAREREQRLRSTVTALEVTRDLHQEVMVDLERQLEVAQTRVEGMEGELSGVRGELKDARTGLDERSRDLHDEMRRLVEMRAMLEARHQELAANLREAESQLAQAAPGADTADLAAKVAQLRTLGETTSRRLQEQEAQAAKLEAELAASRQEASELRTRSDTISGELDNARSDLAQARRRVEELHRAYTRLESEREELQSELATRRGTDSIERKDKDVSSDRLTQSPSSRMDKVLSHLETRLSDASRKAEALQVQVSEERDRAQALASEHTALVGKIDELTADRDHLRAELDRLHSEHFSEHSQHAAQIAVATQSAIEAERRYKEAMQRVFTLENRISELDPITGPDEPQSRTAILRRELITAQEDRDRALDELEAEHPPTSAAESSVIRDNLALVEAELAKNTQARTDLQTRLVATIGERDRLERELSRMRNEQESAAVEHRTALKSARDRLTEAQTRILTLEKDLEASRGQVGAARSGTETRLKAEQAYIQSLENRLADTLIEHEQLSDRVRDLEHELTQARGADGRNHRSAELGDAVERLRAEQARVMELTRSADLARNAATAAEERANHAHQAQLEAITERDRLHLEITRLSAEITRLSARGAVEDQLAEVMADRDHLLTELERTSAELNDLRRRLSRAEREGILAGRVQAERSHARRLEDELGAAQAIRSSDSLRVAELVEQLAAVTAERDHLAAEVERLRQAPVADAVLGELTELRARLVKAKKRIRLLRQQRDAARIGEDAITRETLALAGETDRGRTTAIRAAVHATSAAPDQSGAGRNAFAPTEASAAGGGLTRRIPSDRISLGSQSPGPRMAVFAPGTSGVRPPPPPLTAGLVRQRPPPPPFDPRLLTSRASAPMSLRLRPWLPHVLLASAAMTALGLLIAVISQVPPAGLGEVWAHVQPISAPISGSVTFTGSAGQSLRANEQIALVRNPSVDHSALDALLAKRSALEARRFALAGELATLAAALPEVAPETTRDAEVRRLKERERQERLAAIAVETSEVAELLTAIGPELAAEERRLAALSEARVSIHFDCRVQRTLVADGQTVSQGVDIAQVADPSSIVITAVFGDLRRDAAGVGDAVLVSISEGAALRGIVKEAEAVEPASPFGLRLRVSVPELVGRTELVGQRARLILLGTSPNPVTRALGHLRAW